MTTNGSLPPGGRGDQANNRPASLLEAIRRRGRSALQSGHLVPIRSYMHWVEDGGVRFLVRIATELKRKVAAATIDENESDRNPFLPYDPHLHVADLSVTHVCLLNKFAVVPDHVLIVTRQFEDQRRPLTLEDWQALWMLLFDFPSIGFYNSGKVAGASQRHKHLQAVPLPLDPKCAPPDVPIESQLPLAELPIGRMQRSEDLPFSHQVMRLDPRSLQSPSMAAEHAADGYRRAMVACFGDAPAGPYNLLVTRRWMMLIPRRREQFQGISVNALGYAGALLVQSQADLETIRAVGPMRALTELAGRKQEPPE